MKKIFSIFSVMLIGFSAMSQSIDMWETNVASNIDKTDNMIVSWTIGQVVGSVEGNTLSLITTVNSSSLLLGVEQNAQKQIMEVKLYPNPVNNQVNIDFQQNTKNINIAIYNVNGAIVLQKQYSGNNITISTTDMPNGLYIVKAMDGTNEVAVKKIIIQH